MNLEREVEKRLASNKIKIEGKKGYGIIQKENEMYLWEARHHNGSLHSYGKEKDSMSAQMKIKERIG